MRNCLTYFNNIATAWLLLLLLKVVLLEIRVSYQLISRKSTELNWIIFVRFSTKFALIYNFMIGLKSILHIFDNICLLFLRGSCMYIHVFFMINVIFGNICYIWLCFIFIFGNCGLFCIWQHMVEYWLIIFWCLVHVL